MGIQLLEKRFSLIGARLKISSVVPNRWRNQAGINILQDKTGEFFDIKINQDENVEYEVVDLQEDLRHLLLMARRDESKEKFLCGHDERHWFVCAVPGKSIIDVETAMEALQPSVVRQQVFRKVRRNKNRFTRRNEAFVRQGEWFFVPIPEINFRIDFVNQIYKNEPISRGNGGKAHYCQEVFRSRGESVMVCSRYPGGVSMNHYGDIVKRNPNASRWNWRMMHRNAAVYARGSVRHPDHKTIYLDEWHQVFMNTENEAPGMRHVVFLD